MGGFMIADGEGWAAREEGLAGPPFFDTDTSTTHMQVMLAAGMHKDKDMGGCWATRVTGRR